MLPNLRVLRLGGNAVAALPESLGERPRLSELRLPGNGLSEVPAGAFAGLSGLRLLDLSDNALAGLPGGAFEGLGGLRSLLLEGNALEALPAGLFEGLGALEKVRLSGNPGAPEGLVLTVPAGASRSGPATVEPPEDGELLLARLASVSGGAAAPALYATARLLRLITCPHRCGQ